MPHAYYTGFYTELLARKGKLLCNCSRGRDRGLQLSPVNEEYLVTVLDQSTMTKSLSFVHTARRSYRLGWFGELLGP